MSLLADANAQAAQSPEKAAFFNAITTYDYQEGRTFEIRAAPFKVTTLEFQPGERVSGKVVTGDPEQWEIVEVPYEVSKQLRFKIFFMPHRAGLETSAVVTTDRRTYYLELYSHEPPHNMVAVRWRYPRDVLLAAQTSANRALVAEQEVAATFDQLDLRKVNWNYEVTVRGGRPGWAPELVFDNGEKTFIRFPSSMLLREAPALFVLSPQNEIQLVNYRQRKDYYVVDRLIDAAELRLGRSDVVRIRRK